VKRRLAALVTVGTLLLTAAVFALAGRASAGPDNHLMRWDIVSIDFAAGTVSAGGIASARAFDGSKITLTGTGTFRSNPGNSQAVTGGGTWLTFAPGGAQLGSGTYEVTGFVTYELAPGTPPPLQDTIDGTVANNRAGLLVAEIAYSDGSKGTLTVSCHLVGTPDSVYEGITATKGFVDYTNPEAPPAPPGDANRTLFQVVR
jgi:hypothetical protein